MSEKEVTTLPCISVIMGIYNCAPTLAEALDSLLTQTYQNFKVIMCDDGSKDYTIEVAQKYVDSYPEKFILIRNGRNMGLNYTLNHCLKYADTEFVARMDGDDISLPTRFEKEVEFLEQHLEYAVVSSPMIYFDESGDFRRGRGKGEIKATDFIHGTPICHAPSMSRTKVIKSVGGYSVSDKLLRVEDYHLWFKVFSAGHKLYMLNECLYRMRDDQNAVLRRGWKSRINEFYVKWIGYPMIGLPWYTRIHCFQPIIIGLLPNLLYQRMRRR